MKKQFREFSVYLLGIIFSTPLLYLGFATFNPWLTMFGTLSAFCSALLIWPLAQALYTKIQQAAQVMEVLEKENLSLPTLLEARHSLVPKSNGLQFIETPTVHIKTEKSNFVGPVEFRTKDDGKDKTDLERLEELSFEVPGHIERVLVISDMGVSHITEQDIGSLTTNRASLNRFVTKDIFPKIDLLTTPGTASFKNKNALSDILAVASRSYEKIWVYASPSDLAHYERAFANNHDGILETPSERIL
ncbi:MAG: hypothetical protein AB7H97_04710 [Pseudobdellovibrionaceae bacterium]